MKNVDLIYGLMAAFKKIEYSFNDLLYLSAPLGISETSLRTILSRMHKKKLLIIRKQGKSGYYSFSQKGKKIRDNVAKGFSDMDWQDWNKMFWGIFFTFPENKKQERYKIRRKISAYRFVSLYPGFWIRPYHPDENMEIMINTVQNNKYCRFIKFQNFIDFSKQEISRLWDLEKKNQAFKSALTIIKDKKAKIHSLSPECALKDRFLTGSQIVKILGQDPLLPDIYLPEDWKAGELKKAFLEMDRLYTNQSRSYWQAILKEN